LGKLKREEKGERPLGENWRDTPAEGVPFDFRKRRDQAGPSKGKMNCRMQLERAREKAQEGVYTELGRAISTKAIQKKNAD